MFSTVPIGIWSSFGIWVLPFCALEPDTWHQVMDNLSIECVCADRSISPHKQSPFFAFPFSTVEFLSAWLWAERQGKLTPHRVHRSSTLYVFISLTVLPHCGRTLWVGHFGLPVSTVFGFCCCAFKFFRYCVRRKVKGDPGEAWSSCEPIKECRIIFACSEVASCLFCSINNCFCSCLLCC